MARLPGLASAEATAAFARAARDRHSLPGSHFHRRAGELTLSSFGLGTYIGRTDAATDLAVEQAVALCVRSGRVNVFDTAINYRHQRAERSVGRALSNAAADGVVPREAVFVATKVGYLAPDAEAGIGPDEWIDRELLRSGVLKPSEIVDGAHAMSPRFLGDQFERSRTNLGLGAVDLLYLHNAADAQLPVVGHDEFFVRLAAAFRVLERWRADGALGAYGLATWDCLRTPRGGAGYLSLEEVVRLAREVGGDDHGFRFVQFPFNLAMSEAARLRNQSAGGERRTLFDAARTLGVHVFTSVPLLQGQMARDGPSAGSWTPAQSAIQFARSAPGTCGPLVGQKSPQHLSENLEVAGQGPWDAAEFAAWLS